MLLSPMRLALPDGERTGPGVTQTGEIVDSAACDRLGPIPSSRQTSPSR